MAIQSMYQPASLAEAVGYLTKNPQAVVIAGGTLAIPLINDGISMPEQLLNLSKIGLSYVKKMPDSLIIGACTPLSKLIAECDIPMLCQAASNIGAWQIRNMGTAAGNLFAPPPSGDLGVALLALGASVKLTGPKGSRTVALQDFFTGYLANLLAPDELVEEIIVPRPKGKCAFIKYGRRKHNTPAIVSVAVNAAPDGFKIALGAAGDYPLRAKKAEAALSGSLNDAAIEKAAALAAEESSPFTDAIATEEYRRLMVREFVKRALNQIAGKEN